MTWTNLTESGKAHRLTGMGQGLACLEAACQNLSAKRNSVWKPFANLPVTPEALTSTPKYLHMLPAPL
jgi:hypothetical protein